MLRLRPVTLGEARAFVAAVHRHNDPPIGHRWSVGVEDDAGKLRAVAIIGRPVARNADDGRTVEVLRVASDGARNACSMLYGAAWRAASALGYSRVITYTLDTEDGGSLRAAGYRLDGTSAGGDGWASRPGRAVERVGLFYQPMAPIGPKRRWVRDGA